MDLVQFVFMVMVVSCVAVVVSCCLHGLGFVLAFRVLGPVAGITGIISSSTFLVMAVTGWGQWITLG